jgi:hypothetical protein
VRRVRDRGRTGIRRSINFRLDTDERPHFDPCETDGSSRIRVARLEVRQVAPGFLTPTAWSPAGAATEETA